MEAESHYLYPSPGAEFGQYNIHSPAMIEQLAALLASYDPRSPRIVELVGPPRSGRLLERVTQHRRLILHVRDAHTLDVALPPS